MASSERTRLSYLFGTPRGLVLLTVLALLVAGFFLSLLREPLVGTEAIAWMKERLGLGLLPAEREGRLVILYHILLMPLVAIATYFIAGMLPMRKRLVELVNVTITAGWAGSLVGGIIFVYFGHWHVLWGIIATLVILFFADVSGLKRRARRALGLTVIIGSDIAFAAAVVYEIRKLLVDWTHGLMGGGIAVMALAVVAWRVVVLRRSDGRWKAELAEEVIGIEEEAKA